VRRQKPRGCSPKEDKEFPGMRKGGKRDHARIREKAEIRAEKGDELMQGNKEKKRSGQGKTESVLERENPKGTRKDR